MNHHVPAFYVNTTDITDDDHVRVPLAAALPRLDVRDPIVRQGDRVWVVDDDDNVSSGVVLEQTGTDAIVRVNHDWYRMSLADAEMVAIAGAVRALRSDTRENKDSGPRQSAADVARPSGPTACI
jgi:hypothetical protein